MKAVLLVVKKMPRAIDLSGRIGLPIRLPGREITLSIFRMRGVERSLSLVEKLTVKVGNEININQAMTGESIYQFELEGVEEKG